MFVTFLKDWSNIDSFPVTGDNARIWVISWLNSFKTVAGSESGPAALSGLSFCNIFSISSLLMHISNIVGWGMGPLSDKGSGGYRVNNEVNCWFSISAFLSAELWISPSLLRGETPDEYFRRLLINDQNLFCLGARSSGRCMGEGNK